MRPPEPQRPAVVQGRRGLRGRRRGVQEAPERRTVERCSSGAPAAPKRRPSGLRKISDDLAVALHNRMCLCFADAHRHKPRNRRRSKMPLARSARARAIVRRSGGACAPLARRAGAVWASLVRCLGIGRIGTRVGWERGSSGCRSEERPRHTERAPGQRHTAHALSPKWAARDLLRRPRREAHTEELIAAMRAEADSRTGKEHHEDRAAGADGRARSTCASPSALRGPAPGAGDSTSSVSGLFCGRSEGGVGVHPEVRSEARSESLAEMALTLALAPTARHWPRIARVLPACCLPNAGHLLPACYLPPATTSLLLTSYGCLPITAALLLPAYSWPPTSDGPHRLLLAASEPNVYYIVPELVRCVAPSRIAARGPRKLSKCGPFFLQSSEHRPTPADAGSIWSRWGRNW